MIKKFSKLLIMVFTISIFGTIIESSERFPYKRLDPMTVSSFRVDRVVYQQIEQNVTPYVDDSFAALLIIRDNKMFFFEDGYDDRDEEMVKYVAARASRSMIEDLWPNKISGKLNHALVTDRRVKVLQSFNSEAIERRFGQEYKEARDQLIKQHVQIFYAMLLRPTESEITFVRRKIPRVWADDEPIRYFASVALKTLNGRLYYAEDTNGDGVTDTFTVSGPENFNWGFKSGPNIICILNNTQEDIKEMIGKLVADAFDGPDAFWERARKNIVPADQMADFVDDLYGVTEARPENNK